VSQPQHTSGVYKIFLSCVTNEFLPHRKLLTDDLSLPHVKVQVQEDFIQGGGSTLEKLDQYIKDCAAVIHLVGSATGSSPRSTEVAGLQKRYPDLAKRIPCLKETLDTNPTSLSFTQWEAWLAIYHNVPVYIYRAEAGTVRAPGFVEDPKQRQLQDQHWNRFRTHGKDWTTFREEQQLCRLVLRSLNSILPLIVKKPNVVPKGLRSFDAGDADFFLDLLPGPRDRDGLPESIRFWKHRLENVDETTFRIGVIYGPSGCGKSSLVKAGLLPRLSNLVHSVYIEATANETEVHLLNGLRKRSPDLPGDLDLTATLAELGKGSGHTSARKTLLVIDQFEQWLHGQRGKRNAELVQALRHCDGEHLHCLVLVRDDFWASITRFMQELQIEPRGNENMSLVDLFDPIHARNVLAEFGRAFGCIRPEPSRKQEQFLEMAIDGLCQDGLIVPVRLSLFAQMVKGLAWDSATWKEVGGVEGIGVKFLEKIFSDVRHRRHEEAVKLVLKALLPEQGSNIKGNMQSYGKLLDVSGYAKRASAFDELIQVLDREFRLITPAEPPIVDDEPEPLVGEKQYQLTHDYLVPPVRDWLTRKQKETRRGRAELLLADRAAVWNARPEVRQLPPLWQWLQIQALTQKRNWTAPQQKMMKKATRHHVSWGLALTVLIAVAVATGLEIRNRVSERHRATEAAGLVQSLLNADLVKVPETIEQLKDYRRWAEPSLREAYADAPPNSSRKLRAGLGLLPWDDGPLEYLGEQLLGAQPGEVRVIRDLVAPHKNAAIVDKLWAVAEAPEKAKASQRLSAAAALAKYDPNSEKWAKAQEAIGNDLVAVPAIHLSSWIDLLRDVRAQLLPQLSVVFRNVASPAIKRSLATDILVEYSADNATALGDLLMDADEGQFVALYTKLNDRSEETIPILLAEFDRKLPADMPSSHSDRERLGKRQANAAVALLKLNRHIEKVWPILRHTPDPRARSYLIHRLGPLGVDPQAMVKQLEHEPDVAIRRALVQCLGEFGDEQFPASTRSALLPELRGMYRTEADPGLHASVEWLLRTWKQDKWLTEVNEKWAEGKEVPSGEWRVRNQDERAESGDGKTVSKNGEAAPNSSLPAPRWFVNSQSQTFVVIPGPVEFEMGSPKTEKDHRMEETLHKVRIARSFAIANKPVTLEQYRHLTKDPYPLKAEYERYPDLPVVGINWYMAAAYCNLLSKREGLDEKQWCYETDAKGQVTKLKAKYLSLSGYRLPTEAEIEFAIRAGAVTCRYYGETEELLGRYAWYSENSNMMSQRVGLKKPNDLGLFDAQGNSSTWCQEAFEGSPQTETNQVIDDEEHALAIANLQPRIMRGGSFSGFPFNVRSACRFNLAPAGRFVDFGFRLARTLPPSTVTVLPPGNGDGPKPKK